MLESFHLQRSEGLVNACWQEKSALAQRLLELPPTRLMRPEVIGDRTRLDLLWNGRELGIYSPGKSFFRVDFPDTASAVIAGMMQDFLDSACPLNLASFRFRSGQGDSKGFWIDTSNENIKKILDDGRWLGGLLERGWIVEVGQKHKQVVRDAHRTGNLSLGPATPLCWLASYDSNNEEIPLKSFVSLFSQPGPEVNRALIVAGFELLDENNISALKWAEWGAGYGNLSAAYASRLGERGWVSEFEPAAAELLAMNAKEYFPKLETLRASADEKDPATESAAENSELWLLDPPRSGFGALLKTLKDARRKPRYVLSYHCHHEGLAKDVQLLRDANYRLKNWSSVDAFPATPHHEVISFWEHA